MAEEIRSSMGARLREERESLGLSQTAFGAIAGVSLRTAQDWERGVSAVKSDFLSVAAQHGVDVTYVLTGQRTTPRLSGPTASPTAPKDILFIPLLSATGSMGPGNELITDDVIVDDVPVSRLWVAQNLPKSRPEALKLVHSYGDSMQGTLNSGDFAIVDTDCQVADIDGVYVLQANGQLFIKRVTRRMDGAHVVSSDNPSVRTVDALDGSQQVRICGRVVYGWNGWRF